MTKNYKTFLAYSGKLHAQNNKLYNKFLEVFSGVYAAYMKNNYDKFYEIYMCSVSPKQSFGRNEVQKEGAKSKKDKPKEVQGDALAVASLRVKPKKFKEIPKPKIIEGKIKPMIFKGKKDIFLKLADEESKEANKRAE